MAEKKQKTEEEVVEVQADMGGDTPEVADTGGDTSAGGGASGLSYKDLYQRLVADFQNHKRRVAKERALWMKDAQASVLKPLLGVLDDLERAIESCRKQDGDEGIVAGLELSRKNVAKTFLDLGVKEIDCSGSFDPELHEALLQVESGDHKAGEIVAIVAKGYMFGDEVLRHAKVSVAKE